MYRKIESLKICVGYHRPSFLLAGSCFVPLWGGKAVAEQPSKDGKGISDTDKKWLKLFCIGDDTGDNISHLNRFYCEATYLYWMWKNYDKLGNPDWIGFLQYRRHWVLNSEILSNSHPNEYNLIPQECFRENHQEQIECTENRLLDELKNCDGIFCENETKQTVYDYKSHHHSQNVKYWDKTLQIIRQDWPQYWPAAQKYNAEKHHVWSNCFVMKAQDFLEYAPFLFDVLEKIHEFAKKDYPNMTTPEQKRVPAYVSETMLGCWKTYLEMKGRKLKSFPLLFIGKPFQTCEENIVSDFLMLKKWYFKRLKYSVLAKLCSGKRREKYQRKSLDYNQKICYIAKKRKDK